MSKSYYHVPFIHEKLKLSCIPDCLIIVPCKREWNEISFWQFSFDD